jgi:hypothetical protein
MKALINNVPAGEICCDISNGEGLDKCPILFSLTYFICTIVLATLGVAVTMYKYRMVCCESIANRTKTKTIQDKTASPTEKEKKSSDLYNRIDSTETEESQNLIGNQ